MVFGQSARFPNVTFCNFNRVNRTRAAAMGLDGDTLAYLYAAVPNRPDYGPQVRKTCGWTIAMSGKESLLSIAS